MHIPHKIPTIIGLLLVICVVGVVIFFTEANLRSPSGASESISPAQVKITNVSDSTFTISWVTQAKTTGTVLVSSAGKSNKIYYDQRDSGGKLGSYVTHMVTVRDANALTQYSMKILSNGRQFQDEDKPFEIKTPSSLPINTNGLEPAYGTILTPEGTPAEGALVYLTIDGGQELSSIAKSNGLWLIPLNLARTADLTSLLPILERMDETIRVTHQAGEITATTDSLNDSPVPEMTIGQTYNFRRQNAKTTTNNALALRVTPTAGAVLGTSKGPYALTLTAPGQNAALPTNLPLFSGTGIPDKFVALAIGITKPISGSTKVKPDGTWSFTPPKPLAPGKQSVTITSVDSAGKTVAITRSFEIFKSGTQVLGDATPSATLTPSMTPTPTGVSTISATPAEESTLSGEEIPTSGYELPTILLIVIGLGLLVSGAVAIRL